MHENAYNSSTAGRERGGKNKNNVYLPLRRRMNKRKTFSGIARSDIDVAFGIFFSKCRKRSE